MKLRKTAIQIAVIAGSVFAFGGCSENGGASVSEKNEGEKIESIPAGPEKGPEKGPETGLAAMLSQQVEDAKQQKTIAELRMIEVALTGYSRSSVGVYPTQEQGLKALVEKPTLEPMPRRWRQLLLPEQLIDSWGNEFQYRFPARESTKRYDLWSLGADGKESDDDIRNW